MKFCKKLLAEMDNCDPEWGPFWMNYKFLKKRLHYLATELLQLSTEADVNTNNTNNDNNNNVNINGENKKKSRVKVEQDFFREIMHELKKTSDFFDSSEKCCLIRRSWILKGVQTLKNEGARLTKRDWSRMVTACVNFYKDAVLIENYAVLHLSGFSKIIKKHDKLTGFRTRDSFVRNVVFRQNFVKDSFFANILNESEKMFSELKNMESVFIALEDGQLFLDTIAKINHDKAASEPCMKLRSSLSHANNNNISGTSTTTISDTASMTVETKNAIKKRKINTNYTADAPDTVSQSSYSPI